jgi:GDP-mannose 6-dehydrogenase
VYRAGRLDLNLPLLASAMPSNEAHLARAVEAILELPARKIGVIGLAFKEETDDLRESPVVTMLEQLIGKGRDVRVFDPHIRLDEIYGANRTFILESIPHIGRLLSANLEEVLGWADHLVLAQKQSAATMELIHNSGLPVAGLVEGKVSSSPAGPALSRAGD